MPQLYLSIFLFFNFRYDIICLMSKICHYKQKSYNYIYICMASTRGLLRGKGQKYGFMCTPPWTQIQRSLLLALLSLLLA